MSITVTIEEAQTRLKELLAELSPTEDEVIIAEDGNPVARLLPIKPVHKKRTPGSAAGEIWVAPDFDDPLPDEIIDDFYK
jgi:prevent-host-death family protein